MKYIIHRGITSNRFKENSYTAIKRALIDKSSLGVEFDIRLAKDDKIVFRTHMNNIRQNTTTYYSADDVDFFYTYYNGVHYLIPFSKSGKSETTLRFESKNKDKLEEIKEYYVNLVNKYIKEED